MYGVLIFYFASRNNKGRRLFFNTSKLWLKASKYSFICFSFDYLLYITLPINMKGNI